MTKLRITHLALALAAVLPGCATSGDDAAPLSEEFGHLKATTIPTAEGGAFAELVDVQSDVVVAALDWDGRSSTLELDIADSETSVDLESTPELSDLNTILLTEWYQAELQVNDQIGKADGNPGPVTKCSGSFAYVYSYYPGTAPMSHSKCGLACNTKCGYDWGDRDAHSYFSLDDNPYNVHTNKCGCYNYP